MNRILLALSLLLLAATANADNSRVTDDDHLNCPKPGGKTVAQSVVPASPAVAPQNYAGPAIHGPAANHPHSAAAPRMISPRWHSFLPGMFR
jgi:hypothetical protein